MCETEDLHFGFPFDGVVYWRFSVFFLLPCKGGRIFEPNSRGIHPKPVEMIVEKLSKNCAVAIVYGESRPLCPVTPDLEWELRNAKTCQFCLCSVQVYFGIIQRKSGYEKNMDFHDMAAFIISTH